MPNLRVVSHSDQPFQDRREAGQLLGRELIQLRGLGPVVVGIPRGGIIVARELARVLDADLDVALSRKLRTPGHEELAMGAVAEDGKLFLNEVVIRELGVSGAYIQREKAEQLVEIARRANLVRQVIAKVSLRDRLAIVTDDGVATGATFQAALWSVRQENPERLIAAIPVGSEESLARLAEDADETICLRVPPFFSAVGQFYIRFEPVEDEEVLQALREEQQRKRNKPSQLEERTHPN